MILDFANDLEWRYEASMLTNAGRQLLLAQLIPGFPISSYFILVVAGFANTGQDEA